MSQMTRRSAQLLKQLLSTREIASGKANRKCKPTVVLWFCMWIHTDDGGGAIEDDRTFVIMNEDLEELKELGSGTFGTLATVAALCVQYEAEFRPNMTNVVKALQALLNAKPLVLTHRWFICLSHDSRTIGSSVSHGSSMFTVLEF
ncbi:hypothetical protein KIW84_021735 [Lathyrus oleraceus]|uniref:Uncharacterized protein n=1 Tax=Pisum sativum TaxID=3888 RepID=A0A9D4YD56_PEA|nr:hypothetical protein KIW84_021735 [Pisum sativum]